MRIAHAGTAKNRAECCSNNANSDTGEHIPTNGSYVARAISEPELKCNTGYNSLYNVLRYFQKNCSNIKFIFFGKK